jgi:hypothetical protein
MRIDDGFSTTIAFAQAPSIKFWEKEVTPPGVSGGGATDTTTMRNEKWRTMSPKFLQTLTPCKVTVAYDPAVYDDIVAQVNVNQLITITFPDGSTLAFWGWIDEFTPGKNGIGEQPTAEVTLQPSNQNASQVETDPVFTPAA